jgi:hypothetical protein
MKEGQTIMKKDPTVSFNDPKMLALLKEINQIKEQMRTAGADEVAALRKKAADLEMHYNILSERRGPG